MKLKIARQITRYLPRRVQVQIERQARFLGVVVVHRHRGKLIEEHRMDETCPECAALQAKNQQKTNAGLTDEI